MMNYYNEYRSELSDKIGKYYEQPIPKLTKLTIQFINYGGELAIMGEHFLKFEIEHIVYDGVPELNKFTLTNIFNLKSKYTKKDLNIAYRRLRSTTLTQEAITNIKAEYLRMYENIEE
jgi:hypothetical protein